MSSRGRIRIAADTEIEVTLYINGNGNCCADGKYTYRMFPDGFDTNDSRTLQDREKQAVLDFCKGRLFGHECPVQKECLEKAIQRRECFGVWGGHTSQELRTLIKRRARQKLEQKRLSNAS